MSLRAWSSKSLPISSFLSSTISAVTPLIGFIFCWLTWWPIMPVKLMMAFSRWLILIASASSSPTDDKVNNILTRHTPSPGGQSDLESFKILMLRAFDDLRSFLDNQLKDVHHQLDCLVGTIAELVEFNKSNAKKSNGSHAPIVIILIFVSFVFLYFWFNFI